MKYKEEVNKDHYFRKRYIREESTSFFDQVHLALALRSFMPYIHWLALYKDIFSNRLHIYAGFLLREPGAVK